MKVNIEGLSTSDVLLALYNNAGFKGTGFSNQSNMMQLLFSMAPKGRLARAKELIRDSKNYYFDYVDLGAGPRPLKVDLSNNEFDPHLFDRDHGIGAAEKAISDLRVTCEVAQNDTKVSSLSERFDFQK